MFNAFVLVCISLVCVRAETAPAFDIVSIHLHAPDDTRFVVHMPTNGHFSTTGSVAKLIVMIAYDVQESQILLFC